MLLPKVTRPQGLPFDGQGMCKCFTWPSVGSIQAQETRKGPLPSHLAELETRPLNPLASAQALTLPVQPWMLSPEVSN